MEIEMEQLQTLVGEAMEQAQSGYRAFNDSRAEVEDLTQKLRAALEGNQRLRLKEIEEKAVVQRYKSENMALDTELTKVKEELEGARAASQQLKADLARANIARTEFETELFQNKQVLAEANAEAAQQGDRLTTTQEEAQKELQRLKDALAAAQGEREQIIAELADQRKYAEEKSAEALELNAQLIETRQELDAATVGVEGQKQAIEETLAAAMAQEEDLALARRQVVELKEGLANADTSIKNLQAEFDGLSSAIEANVKQLLDAAKAQLKSDVTSIGMKLETAVREIGELNATSVEAKIQATE